MSRISPLVSRSPSGSPSYSPDDLPVYRGGFAGPTFNPSDIASIVDYGIWSDLSRLKQNEDGTGAVSSVDDPIGFWRGQLDVLTFTQATSSNKPKLGSGGVYYLAAGNAKRLNATHALPVSGPWAIAIAYTQDGPGTARGVDIAADTGPSSFNLRHRIGGDSSAGVSASINAHAGTSFTAGPISAANLLLSFDGASAVGSYNGTESAVAVGGGTTEPTVVTLTVWDLAAESSIRGWAVFSTGLTPTERSQMANWMDGL